jgi:hypothetical protein
MSDLVPEHHFDGIVRVVKLINGDELLGIVRDATSDKVVMILPAKIESAFTKDETGGLVEYVKLINYAANVVNHEISINRNSIMYIAAPIPELNAMYDAFFITMKTDPTAIINNSNNEILMGPEAGLQMLNDLFTNEDFINFVNDMIDSFEAAEILIDDEDIEEIEESEPELPVMDTPQEEAPSPPKPKKRRIMNPEGKKLPFNPEGDPKSAESWSDDPKDYI